MNHNDHEKSTTSPDQGVLTGLVTSKGSHPTVSMDEVSRMADFVQGLSLTIPPTPSNLRRKLHKTRGYSPGVHTPKVKKISVTTEFGEHDKRLLKNLSLPKGGVPRRIRRARNERLDWLESVEDSVPFEFQNYTETVNSIKAIRTNVSAQLNQPFIRFIEGALMLWYDLNVSTTVSQRQLSIARFWAHINERTVSSTAFEIVSNWFLIGMELGVSLASMFTEPDERDRFTPQGYLDTFASSVDKFEWLYDHAGRLFNSPIAKRLKSAYLVMMAALASKEEGVEVTKQQIEELKRSCETQDWFVTNDPVEFLIRASIAALRSVAACIRVGHVSPMFGDQASIMEWFMKAQDIVSLESNIAILDIHGTNIHELANDLNTLISKGEILVRAHKGNLAREALRTLVTLKSIKNDLLSHRAATELRDPPFSVLLHGGTSVAKSSILDILYTYIGKLKGLDTDEKFRYARNSTEDHWNNFTSAHWCIVFDEIAPRIANANSEIDEATAEILRVCNTVPYTPPQASLEDKGKTPCRAKLVLGTTNIMDLSVPVLFHNPTAIMRRFHLIVDVSVKREFQQDNSEMLDWKKTDSRSFPNYWDFVVYKAVPVTKRGIKAPLKFQTLSWEKIATFTDIKGFLRHVRDRVRSHEAECAVLLDSHKVTSQIDLCGSCQLPTSFCECPFPEDESDRLSVDDPDSHYCFQADDEDVFFDAQPSTRVRSVSFETGEHKEEDPQVRIERLVAEAKENLRKAEAYAHQEEEMRSRTSPEGRRRSGKTPAPRRYSRASPEFAGTARSYEVPPILYEAANMYFTHGFWAFYSAYSFLIIFRLVYYCGLGWIGMNLMRSLLFKRQFRWGYLLILYATSITEVNKALKNKHNRRLLGAVVFAGAAWLYWPDLRALFVKTKSCAEKEAPEVEIGKPPVTTSPSEEPTSEYQGLKEEIERSQFNQEPVWYKHDYVTTSYDVGRLTPSWKCMERSELERKLGRNVARIEVWNETEDRVLKGSALCVGAKLWITNAHFFSGWSSGTCFPVSLLFGGGPGLGPDYVKLSVFKSSIILQPEHDLAFIWLDSVCPRRDIRALLPKKTLQGVHSGFTMGFVRTSSASIERETDTFRGAHLAPDQELGSGRRLRVFKATMSRPSAVGQCGRVAISMSNMGPIVLGIHSVGQTGLPTVGFVPIYEDEVEKAWKQFTLHFISSSSIMLPEGSPTIQPVLHAKSPVRFVEQGTVEIIGTIVGARSTPKSHFTYTRLAKPLLAMGWPLDAFKPPMVGWEPKYNVLKGIVKPDNGLEPRRLKEAAAILANAVIERLPTGWEREMGVVDVHIALNGIPGVAHMDRINVSTSCGFPYGGPKKKFLHDDFGDLSGELECDESILEQVTYILDCWAAGELAGVVINAALKDEPRSRAKVEAKKVRMFQVTPMALTIAMRQVLLPFLRMFYVCHEAFFSAPGVDASSGEWDQAAQWLAFDGKLIDGDYGMFDATMVASVMDAIAHFVVRILDASGQYTSTQLLQAHCSILEVCHIFLNFFGDLVRLPGMNSSGNAGTVAWNCFANMLFLFIAYQDLAPEGAPSFFDALRILLYGDDNLISVRDDVSAWYYFGSIRQALSKYGIEYTTADKKITGPPHKRLEEVEFLKRGFRFDEEIGHYMAPLKRESIAKMVMCTIPSKSVTTEVQLIQSMESAVREAFLHGRTFHNYVLTCLRAACDEAECGTLSLTLDRLTYDYLLVQYVEKSRKRDFFKGSRSPGMFQRPTNCEHLIVARLISVNQNEVPEDSYCSPIEQEVESVDLQVEPPGRSPKSLFSDVYGCSTKRSPPTVPMISRPDGLNNQIGNQNIIYEDAETSQQHMEFQAEESPLIESHEETVVFTSENSGDVDGFKATPVSSSQTESSSLGQFLSRPVQIMYQLWTKTIPPGPVQTIQPWYLFLNNSYIKNKIANYSYIRGNLHVKVLVNATPFVYGAALISYNPLSGYAQDTTGVIGATTNYLIGRSQRPHVWIYPSDNEGGEIVLPFFYFKDFLELGNASFAKAMGALTLDVAVPLRTANGGTAPDVSVQVYAWMTEVELSGPTVGFVLQAKDEYLGPISAPASAVASMARSLRSAPVIGRLATATEVGASAIASMSSLFGFSNVVNLSGGERVVNNSVPELATVGHSYPTAKLSLDPKNELTVDGRSLGLPAADDLNISDIVQRESFVDYFGWEPTDVSDKLLFLGRVTPRVYKVATTSGSTVLDMTPMAWVSRMFRHWRGDLVYKLRFVATPFHKGRVIISYDPTGTSTANLGNVSDTTAAVHTYIVDLAVSREFEFRVPYSQARPWCRLQDLMRPAETWADFTTPTYNYERGADNGTISVRVQTELSSPDGATGVAVMMFVKGADNLEFANPDMPDLLSEYTTPFVPQAEVHSFGESEPPAGRYLLNMGENIVSLRSLMQRRSRLTMLRQSCGIPGGIGVMYLTIGRTPFFPGYDANGFHNILKQDQTTSTRGVIAHWHPVTWLWRGFVGNRGALEYTVYRDGDPAAAMRAVRTTSDETPGVLVPLNAETSNSSLVVNFLMLNTPSGTAGSAMVNPGLTPAMNVSFPMYQSNKFGTNDAAFSLRNTIPSSTWPDDSASSTRVVRNATALDLDREFDNMRVEVRTSFNKVCDSTLDIYLAAGTDFSLLWFLNAPQVYACQAPTSASS